MHPHRGGGRDAAEFRHDHIGRHGSPDGSIIAIIAALSADHITPVPLANKVFIMAMGPDQYKYQGFLNIGIPLAHVMGVLRVGVTPRLFPLKR